jgi:hypothetical protein
MQLGVTYYTITNSNIRFQKCDSHFIQNGRTNEKKNPTCHELIYINILPFVLHLIFKQELCNLK